MKYAVIMGELYAFTDKRWLDYVVKRSTAPVGEVGNVGAFGRRLGDVKDITDYEASDWQDARDIAHDEGDAANLLRLIARQRRVHAAVSRERKTRQ